MFLCLQMLLPTSFVLNCVWWSLVLLPLCSIFMERFWKIQTLLHSPSSQMPYICLNSVLHFQCPAPHISNVTHPILCRLLCTNQYKFKNNNNRNYYDYSIHVLSAYHVIDSLLSTFHVLTWVYIRNEKRNSVSKAVSLEQRKVIMKTQVLCFGGRMPSPRFRGREIRQVNDFNYILHFRFILGFRMVNVWPLTSIFFNRHLGHGYWMMSVNRSFPAATVLGKKLS